MNYEIKFQIKYKIDFSKCLFKSVNKNQIYVFKNYKNKLNKEKEIIDTLDDNYIWDKMKKRTNPYELIYTTYNKRKKDSIADIKPLSRSYFKILEIDNKIPLIHKKDNISICNLAEGPGGFMEALHHKYPSANLVGLTLPPENKFIPDWNKLKSTIDTNKMKVCYGNLYIYSDIKKFVKEFKYNKVDLVTADGGFDYSSDFNGQEINSHKIIFSEIFVSLLILKEGGNLVCKIFDIFSIFTIQILKIVCSLFNRVILYKPKTSRPANSEKYLICIGYNSNIELSNINKLLKKCLDINNNVYYIENIRIENELYKILNEYNKIYIKNQIYYLKYTIKLIDDNQKYKIKSILYDQINNAIEWCKENNIPINQKSTYYNMLLKNNDIVN
jgi:23S rRNA U2552 (ribose-2'-O)-methylase RlmE/FtsJ